MSRMPEASGALIGCIDCDSGLEHCHGTWIHHRDGTGECTVTHCHVEIEGHAVVIDCIEVHVDCADLG